MTKLTAADRATRAILTPADREQLEHIRLRRGSGVSAYLDGYRAGRLRGLEEAAEACGTIECWDSSGQSVTDACAAAIRAIMASA